MHPWLEVRRHQTDGECLGRMRHNFSTERGKTLVSVS
jgi:hypothetical protein